MLTAEDKNEIKHIVVEVIKDVVMPALQVMDEKMYKINADLSRKIDGLENKIDSIDIKVDEIALNQKKDRKRIEVLEKAFANS